MTAVDHVVVDAEILWTPTGMLVSTALPQSDEWFAVRRAGITATDLPKILGLSKYGDARSVWHDKRGELPRDEAGEAAHWGHLLEGIVAGEWARRRAVTLEDVGVLANDEHRWMLAALDRLPDHCPDGDGPCGLEIKTRSAYVAGRWRDDQPDDVLAQVAWQRMVTGLGHIHTAALIGGQRLVEHRYDRDEQLERLLLAEARQVWDQVQAGEMPVVEPGAILADMLDRLFPDRSGETEVEPGRGSALVEGYRHAQSLEREAKTTKEAARAAVLDALGPGEALVCDGAPLFTYRAQTKRSIPVAALKKADPALLTYLDAVGHLNETSSRVLRLTDKGDTE
jgi:putative phage-type endonuclease